MITMLASEYQTLGTPIPWSLTVLVAGLAPRSGDAHVCAPLRVPCTLMYGERDELRHVCAMTEALYDCPLVFVHRGGHEFPLESGCRDLAAHMWLRMTASQ